MSSLDSELTALRDRLAKLEEQKRIEQKKEERKKAFPLKTLGDIIEAKKRMIKAKNCTPKEFQMSRPIPQERARLYDQEKVEFLEPILILLTDIQDRLDVLEHIDSLS